jgi:peptidylprolyl isomerase
MKISENGDTVKVHYTGKLKEGDVFDSSEGREPLEFQLGSGMVIEGFNDGLIGMKEGEKKSIEIPVEKAYGPKNQDYIVEIPKDKLDNSQEFQVGMQVSFSNEQQGGQPIPVEVVAVSENTVTFDANPPLAGKDLVFDVEMVGILKG